VRAKVTPIWRREDRADHIYRVAAGIMCRKGYEATTMSDIAEAVGLTKAGMYHYIRGKEHLLFSIMSFAMDIVDQHVIGPAEGLADAEQRLRTMIELHARRILESGGEVTILLEEMWALTPPHRRIIRRRKRVYFEAVRGTLEQLASEGKLRNVDPSVATFSLFGMVNWISRWYRRNGKLSPEAIVRDFTEIALSSVLRTDSGAPAREPAHLALYPAGSTL
jgi:TetR/AcrR family transcriptional regulator, cholesterol catabolism regulator